MLMQRKKLKHRQEYIYIQQRKGELNHNIHKNRDTYIHMKAISEVKYFLGISFYT